ASGSRPSVASVGGACREFPRHPVGICGNRTELIDCIDGSGVPSHSPASMPKTYSDLLAEVNAQVRTVSLDELKRRIEEREPYTLVDVREKDEVRQGYLPGAVHVPRGFLEMQAEQRLPDKDAKIVVYCAGGVRSAFAAKTLQDLG